jgi:hypothetical protein
MILTLEGSKSAIIARDADLSMFRSDVCSKLHGNYTESSLRGHAFSVNGESIVLGDIATTVPSFGLYNFCDSGRYLSLIRWEIVVTTAPVTPVIGAMLLGVISVQNGQDAAGGQGTRPTDTTLCVRPNSRATAYLANFTLPSNPTIYRTFVNHLTGAPSISVARASYFMEFDGTCLIVPGRVIVLGQLNVDGTKPTIDTLVVWEEIEI